MRILLALFVGIFLASCSINSTVEVQSAASDGDDGKPNKPSKPAQPAQPETSEPSQPEEPNDPNDPMYAMKGFAEGTLGANLEGFSKILLETTDWSDGPENRTTTKGEVTKGTDMRELFRLVEPKQTPTEAAPTCLFSHMLDFVDNDGKKVGRVGICTAAEFKRQHAAVFVTLGPRGKTLGRQGLTLTSAPALAKAVEKHTK